MTGFELLPIYCSVLVTPIQPTATQPRPFLSLNMNTKCVVKHIQAWAGSRVSQRRPNFSKSRKRFASSVPFIPLVFCGEKNDLRRSDSNSFFVFFCVGDGADSSLTFHLHPVTTKKQISFCSLVLSFVRKKFNFLLSSYSEFLFLKSFSRPPFTFKAFKRFLSNLIRKSLSDAA